MSFSYLEKKICWQTLSLFLENHDLRNIVVAGDLNIVLEPKEKRGGNIGNIGKDPFQETVDSLIHAHDLLDLKPKKGSFTWTNNRLGLAQISARLDRFLVQSSLLDFGIHLHQFCISSHHTIILLLFYWKEKKILAHYIFVSILFGMKGMVLGN